MCNCIKDTEKQLMEMIKADSRFKKLESFKVFYPNVALAPNKDNIWSTSYLLDFNAEGKYKTKSGNIKTKRESLSVRMAYCPLCGEKM